MSKILVVDDQPSITWLLDAVLSGEDHMVLTASGGHEALALMRLNQPDLVISDVKMPLMNGLELVEQIGKDFPGAKCILMSGDVDFSDPEMLARTLRLKVCGTLAKPFLMGQLMELVDGVLAGTPPTPVS